MKIVLQSISWPFELLLEWYVNLSTNMKSFTKYGSLVITSLRLTVIYGVRVKCESILILVVGSVSQNSWTWGQNNLILQIARKFFLGKYFTSVRFHFFVNNLLIMHKNRKQGTLVELFLEVLFRYDMLWGF